MTKIVLPIALYLCLTIGLAISLSIWNEWFSLSQRIDLDTYFTLFGAITATVICVPNILTISKGLSIAAKVNLVTIAFILLTCSVNFIITNGSTVSSSLGTLLSVISLMLYKSPLYQAFLAHFNSLHFKKP
ncbi:hypothetical protein L1076_19115 [Vibrio sp. MMG022]|uniref:hypothetical protein n=1 Tax=Vibrio sp. MMG023 TaxID=2909979 RepID=UPI000ABAA10B|nr:hypothetical protein [Vibrio sp. MMG023]MCF6453692.1 hypothetical protein [Vibrio sp. MMG023]